MKHLTIGWCAFLIYLSGLIWLVQSIKLPPQAQPIAAEYCYDGIQLFDLCTKFKRRYNI